jgi:hypothetical protein
MRNRFSVLCRVGFCPKKLLKHPEPVKPYNFAIEDASDRSMRLVFAILGRTLQDAGSDKWS